MVARNYTETHETTRILTECNPDRNDDVERDGIDHLALTTLRLMRVCYSLLAI